MARMSGVSMDAGATAFTVTPLAAYSRPTDFTMPITPALEAE